MCETMHNSKEEAAASEEREMIIILYFVYGPQSPLIEFAAIMRILRATRPNENMTNVKRAKTFIMLLKQINNKINYFCCSLSRYNIKAEVLKYNIEQRDFLNKTTNDSIHS